MCVRACVCEVVLYVKPPMFCSVECNDYNHSYLSKVSSKIIIKADVCVCVCTA